MGVIGAFIGGGGDNNKPNRVTDQWGTIGGGSDNQVNDSYTTIGGGQSNSFNGILGTIAGGLANKITSGDQNIIGGGGSNLTDGRYAVIAGGSNNIASGMNATIGGGGAAHASFSNHATGDYSTISGGVSNFTTADYGSIGGGGNIVSTDPTSGNLVSDEFGTVGGRNNQAGDDSGASNDRSFTPVSGSRGNTASGTASTIGGGDSNTASGWRSSVPGGVGNSAAGDHSFPAGRRAKTAAAADGSFVWSDSNDFDTMSWGPNEFVARATGGFWLINGINLSIGAIDSGMHLAPGGNQWNSLSDRNSKTAFDWVDGRQVVARLAEIPIMTWQYISQPDDIRHMGPMAQDFYDAFGLGEDERYIGSLDADGVSLAPIQGLYALSQERANQIQEIQSENETLSGQLDDLEERVRLLEAGAAPPSAQTYNSWAITLLLGLGLVAVMRAKRWTPGKEG